jgi:hypothetical protein
MPLRSAAKDDSTSAIHFPAKYIFQAPSLEREYDQPETISCWKDVRRNRLNLRNMQGDAMLRNNADEKAEIYETLSSMNRAFAGIVQHLQTLHQTGLFKSKAARLFPSFTLELQAEFNQEFLENLHQLELDDWGRYGKARDKYEKHLRDPDDVFIHAKERKKQLAKQRKRTTK